MTEIAKQAVQRGAANDAISSLFDMFTEFQELAQHIIGCFIKMPTCTAFITRLVKRQAYRAVMNEAKCFDPATNVGKKNEEATIRSPPKVRSQLSSVCFKHDEKKKSEKDKEARHSTRCSCKKCGSSRCSSEDYKVDRVNKYAKGVDVLRMLNTHFINALKFSIYRLFMHSKKDGHTSGKIAKWATWMDIKMISTNFKLSGTIFVPSFLYNFETAYDINGIHEAAARWLFQRFSIDPVKASSPHRACAMMEDRPQQEGETITCCDVVNYLPASYDTDDAIADVEAALASLKQLAGISGVRYSEMPWEKTLRFDRVYDE